MSFDIGLHYWLMALRADVIDIQGLLELIHVRHGYSLGASFQYPHALLGNSCKVKIAHT